MIQFPSSPPRKRWIAAATCLVALCGSSHAQNFTMQLADSNPLGIGNFVPDIQSLDFGLTEDVKGDLIFGIGADTVYNSNFYLAEDDPESEFSINLSPVISYTSDPEGGAPFTFDVSYTPRISTYFNDSDLNAFDQSGDFTITLVGSRTEVAIFGRYAGFSGTDNLTGDYVQGSVLTGGMRATRQIASRTALNAGWTAAVSEYGSSNNEGATMYSGYFGGMWESSPRLSLGATLRYTMSESDIVDSQDAWAVLMEARYRLGERIWLSASLGPEFTSGSDVRLAGDVTAGYMINERWSWVNTLRSATVPAPNESNTLLYDIRLMSSLQRQLLRGSVSGGFDYSLAQYEQVGPLATKRGDEKNLGFFVTYQRPLFLERVAFNSTVRYAFNQGQTDWDQWLVTTGLTMAF